MSGRDGESGRLENGCSKLHKALDGHNSEFSLAYHRRLPGDSPSSSCIRASGIARLERIDGAELAFTGIGCDTSVNQVYRGLGCLEDTHRCRSASYCRDIKLSCLDKRKMVSPGLRRQ